MKSVKTSNFFLFWYSKLQNVGNNRFVCVCVRSCMRACTPPLKMFKQRTDLSLRGLDLSGSGNGKSGGLF